jgi:hypothetical protein
MSFSMGSTEAEAGRYVGILRELVMAKQSTVKGT